MRRLAIGGAFHKTVFSPKYRSAVKVPSQRTASAIAARCISTCSALHPAHRPSAILTAPAIPRLHNKPAAPSHQVSQPFQTLPPLHPSHFKPPLSHFPIVPTTLLLPHKTLPHHHPPASDSQPGIVALHTHHSPPLYPQRQSAFPIPHHGPPQPQKTRP